MIKIKTFLKENKIYFETVLVVIIAVAGCIISYFQYKVADSNLMVMRAQAQPFFRISNKLEQNSLSRKYEYETYFFYNDGEMIKNAKIYYNSFLSVKCSSLNSREKTKEITFPVTYFGISKRLQSGKGLLYELSGFGANHSEKVRIDQELSKLNKNMSNDMLSYHIFHTFKIEYEDILQQRHIEYFLVNTDMYLTEISQVEYEKYLKNSNKQVQVPIDIHEFQVDKQIANENLARNYNGCIYQ